MSDPATSIVPATVAPKAPLALSERGVRLQSLDDLMRLSTMLVASGLAPKGDTPTSIAVKIQCGMEVGLPPMQSLNYIAVIGNRPSIWGQGAHGLVLSSGALAKMEEFFEGEEGSPALTSVTRLWRKGFPTPFEGRFSVADAKAAKLLGKDTYQAFLKDMLRWRSRSRAYDAGFADVLGGLPLAEVAIVDRDVQERTAIEPAPQTSQDAPGSKLDRLAQRLKPLTEPTATLRPLPGATAEEDPPWMEADREVMKQVAEQFDAQAQAMAGTPTVQWEASPERTLRTVCPVTQGPWNLWAGEEVPPSALQKRASTWRQAAEGGLNGYRYKMMKEAAEAAARNPADRSEYQERCACALAVLIHKASKAAAPAPQSDPEAGVNAPQEATLFEP